MNEQETRRALIHELLATARSRIANAAQELRQRHINDIADHLLGALAVLDELGDELDREAAAAR